MSSESPGRAQPARARGAQGHETDPASPAPKLGVGIMYNPALPEFLRAHIGIVDYVSIIPDMFWIDRGLDTSPRYAELDFWVDILDWLAAQRPVVAHNIGFSLGSADLFDRQYLEHIVEWHERYRFPWYSDHLSFAQVSGADGHEENAGLAVPIPFDHEVLEMVATRIDQLRRRISTPFLVENSVYYVVYPEQEMTEPEFLNSLSGRAGCGLLLDVHNLYANARNHGFDARRFLRELDLSRVIEVHIAGGLEIGGMYTDSHSGACPEPVWALLEEVVPRTPNLRGITFEFHDSFFPVLGPAGVRVQLERAREIWARSNGRST